MRILVLLPGIIHEPAMLPVQNHFYGVDLFGVNQLLNQQDFVNNFQTIAALKDQMPEAEVEVRFIVNRGNPVSLFRTVWQLRKFLLRNKIELVYQFWGGPAAWACSLFCTVPYVLALLGSDLMGTYTSSGRLSAKGYLLRGTSILAAANAEAVVVMSHAMHSSLPKWLRYKSVVVPEGIDSKLFYPMEKDKARQLLNWGKSELVILFFDNGHRVKNRPFADNVAELVKTALPNVRLQIVSAVPHHQLVYYYNAADVLLITSLHEGSNNSLKEAISCNCPVVSSEVGDASERLDGIEGCKAISGFNAKEYAAAIINILGAKKRCDGSGQLHLISTFSVGNRLAKLFNKVLNPV